MKVSSDVKEDREDHSTAGDGVPSTEENVYGSPPLDSNVMRKGNSLHFIHVVVYTT